MPSTAERLLNRQLSELGDVSVAVQGERDTAGAGHLLRCAKAVTAFLKCRRLSLPWLQAGQLSAILAVEAAAAHEGCSLGNSCALQGWPPGDQHLVHIVGREKVLAKTCRHCMQLLSAAPGVTALQVCEGSRLLQPHRRAVPRGRGMARADAGGRACGAACGRALCGAPRGAAAAAHVQEVRVGEAGRGAPRRLRACEG